MASEFKGKAVTILGPISPRRLGKTLTHEHLPFTYDDVISSLAYDQDCTDPMALSPMTMENLWWIRQNPYHHKENNLYDDLATREAVLHELKFFKENGGGTIVDNSSSGLNRIPELLEKYGRQTNVNIICGTGFYIAASQSQTKLAYTEERMIKVMQNELVDGFQGTRMKCGIIGEIGTSWPIDDFEKRVLRSAGQLQEALGCPVNIHPGRSDEAPFEIMRIFQEAGGKASKTVMSHLERTIFENTKLAEFLSCGVYCEFDLFGIETSNYQLNPSIDMPSDAQRIARLKKLADNGFENKIVISHDLHTKHRLMKFGGHGFSHILLNVVPQMLRRGFAQDQIDKILVQNPAEWLTY